MSKLKWALELINSTKDIKQKLQACKSVLQAAENHFNKVEDRFAKPMLLTIFKVENDLKELPSEYKEILAKSHYLMAEIIIRSSEQDNEAVKHLEKAQKLMPSLKEAADLKKSIEIENVFFKEKSGVKKNH